MSGTDNCDVFICPNCGEEVPMRARACPHCGSDENTGWSEATYLDGLDLPEEDFTETLRREYGVDLERRRWRPFMTVAVASLMILLLILYSIRC